MPRSVFAPSALLAGALLLGAASAEARPYVAGQVPPALAPTLDGSMARLEWADAASVFAKNGAAELGDYPLAALFVGRDRENLYLALQPNGALRPLTLVWTFPRHPLAQRTFTARLGPDGLHLLDAQGRPVAGPRAASGQAGSELALPWAAFAARPGEPFTLQLDLGPAGRFPAQPLSLRTPEQL